jgi:hypothetical protein
MSSPYKGDRRGPGRPAAVSLEGGQEQALLFSVKPVGAPLLPLWLAW